MEYKVEELIESISKTHTFPNNEIIFLNTSDIEKGYVLHRNYSETKSLPGQAKKSIQKGDILYSEIRPKNERYAYIDFECENYVVSTKLMVLRNKKPKTLNTRFFYLYITSRTITNTLQNLAESRSGTFPQITYSEVKKLQIKLPNLTVQNKIVKTIESINQKIVTNQKIIANLQELSQTLFKRWFVDFEFPDENGNPYKSSGGEMVDSELGEIPKEWSIQTLNDISENYNTKRKPLSKLEREKVTSIYPYYGATKIIDYVDDYLFDGKFILVGEDGTVQTEEGHPFVQYVWGKFWVSNHAHILKGNNLSDETLMLILNNIDIEPYITGAVQPKISKKNLNGIKVIIGTKLIYEKFDQYSDIYYKKIREISEEIKNLIELRDTLLPKLMSGELEIPDDIEVNEDELSI